MKSTLAVQGPSVKYIIALCCAASAIAEDYYLVDIRAGGRAIRNRGYLGERARPRNLLEWAQIEAAISSE